MVQQVKLCAGCGAQMGSRGRVCPRCGRGSLFGELLWIAVLGVLLLGIGVLSGLVPVDRVPGLRRVPGLAVDRDTTARVTSATRPASSPRQTRKLAKIKAAHQPRPTMAPVPCSDTDSVARRALASDSPRKGPHTPALGACRDVTDTTQGREATPAGDTITPR
jgi:hypothetical protein